MATVRDITRVAAMSDIHYGRSSAGMLASVFAHVSEHADLLLLGGDLTDYGMAEEARVLARDITTSLKIPVVGVLGNHDYEAGEEAEISRILSDAGVHMLDGDSFEVHGVGIAGVRGFCGGFGRGALGAWGEKVIKAFVHEAVHETLKLESALARLKTEHRIALVHYAPIRETVVGEPLEIFAFLGSSRMEEPLARYSVTAVFHGHAHKGTPEGKTATGIPVFNVALPLLRERYPNRPPYRLLELKLRTPAEPVPAPARPDDRPVGSDGNEPLESEPVAVGERRSGGRRSGDRG